MSWMADLLSNSQSCIWDKISTHQDLNTSSASAEYLPLNLVILGSCMCQNSFNVTTAEVKLELHLAMCIFLGLVFYELDGRFVIQLAVLYVG